MQLKMQSFSHTDHIRVLKSYTWLVAIVLDKTNIKNISITLPSSTDGTGGDHENTSILKYGRAITQALT